MVELTQHGEAFYRGACRNCHCEFSFCLRDINYDKDNSKFPFYISCPECRTVFRGDTTKVVAFMLKNNHMLNYQPSPF